MVSEATKLGLKRTSAHAPLRAARPTMPHGLPQIWPHLSPYSRSWLIEHYGELLPDHLVAGILSAAGAGPNAQWWSGPSVESRPS